MTDNEGRIIVFVPRHVCQTDKVVCPMLKNNGYFCILYCYLLCFAHNNDVFIFMLLFCMVCVQNPCGTMPLSLPAFEQGFTEIVPVELIAELVQVLLQELWLYTVVHVDHECLCIGDGDVYPGKNPADILRSDDL